MKNKAIALTLGTALAGAISVVSAEELSILTADEMDRVTAGALPPGYQERIDILRNGAAKGAFDTLWEGIEDSRNLDLSVKIIIKSD